MSVPLLQNKNKIHPGTNTTIGEAFLALLTFYLSHNISDVEMIQYCVIANFIVGKKIFPETKYYFDQQISQSYGSITYHFLCGHCSHILCSKSHSTVANVTVVDCPSCGNENTLQLSNENFFVTFDVKSQIRTIFANRDVQEYFKTPSQDGTISDCYDGTLYVELAEKYDNFLTYNFNIDSAPLFNSGKINMTPILLIINELPLKVRNQNVVVAGMWCGKKEVVYDAYLEQFAKVTLDLDDGINLKSNGTLIEVKFKPLCSPNDSVARAKVINSVHHMGKMPCPWCFINGTKVCKECMKFPLGDELPPLRTDDDIIRAGITASETGIITEGIKGVSQLIRNETFKQLRGFPVDYLHAPILGVTRQLVNKWCTETKKPYYIGSPGLMAVANEITSRIKFPTELKSFTYTLDNRAQWKGSDWRDFLLYCSHFVTHAVLPLEYALHWSLLIKSINILMSTNITDANLQTAKDLLIDFNYGVQELYGDEEMTYNVHILLHLPETVKNCGPLFVCSTLPFEAFLYLLKQMVHSPLGAMQQICKKICIRSLIHDYINRNDIPDMLKDILGQMDKFSSSIKPKIKFVNSNIAFSEIESHLIERNGFDIDEISACKSVTLNSGYYKVNYDGNIGPSCRNSIVVDDLDNCYLIKKIFYVNNNPENKTFYGIMRHLYLIDEKEGMHLSHIKILDDISNDLAIIELSKIAAKCFYFKQNNIEYIIRCLSCKECD